MNKVNEYFTDTPEILSGVSYDTSDSGEKTELTHPEAKHSNMQTWEKVLADK